MIGKVTFEELFIGGDVKMTVTAEVEENSLRNSFQVSSPCFIKGSGDGIG